MEKTWRWFGKNDKITLPMLRQIGVEGIVTALHDIKNGEIWTVEAIMDLKNYIESHGLRWSVVESLPVCEAIKYGGADRDRLIENYKISLANLGKCGIHTICYNFMPVLDWARTELDHPWEDGSTSLYFNKVKFVYFDCYILKRKGAEADYSDEELAAAAEMDKHMTEADKAALVDTIIVKTQGFVNGNISEKDNNPVELFRNLLSLYDGITPDKLRENMKYFLEQIMPVCEEWNMNMCVHPDDPPMQLLGLPRIVTCDEDIEWFLSAVDNPHNGLTFCCGSLSAGAQNDIPALARKYAKRTHFVHLRSTDVLPNGDFIEADHLHGRANLIEVCRIFEEQNPNVPMRVDHGRTMLGDEDKGYNAGYSFHGRMMGLAQMDGVMATVKYLKNKS
ncbi:MAG: mannonate dehydratase [Bacteroidaceae bacterium]|jgi:mannonate dehydratase|nr:mannonate dehydratase [Bacteroidaceae bacterium]